MPLKIPLACGSSPMRLFISPRFAVLSNMSRPILGTRTATRVV
jgi:hypothetical protein